MSERSADEVRNDVRSHYAQVACGGAGCCGSGCAPSPDASLALGYGAEELAAAPVGANLGLGCGNPQAIAGLRTGETVLDLGSGGGFDCFLAAKQVGPSGRVIGVDMTPEMISRARANAARVGASNVEFRLGEIERLPVADGEVDVILSNCVINLSPDKAAVFREAARVLKPGGRLAIADVVATAPVPDALRRDLALHAGCVAGAATADEVAAMLRAAGLAEVRVEVRPESREFIRDWFPGLGAEDFIASATIEAVRPREGACCAPGCCGGPGGAA